MVRGQTSSVSDRWGGAPQPAAATVGHGWVSAGVSFWSAPPHDPEGAVSPADPARISRHSGHSAQPSVPPREAGALYPRKNHGKVPPPPQQDPRDPPHSHGNAPMAHRCCFARPAYRNRGPLMSCAQPRWPIVAVARPGPAASVGHRCGELDRNAWFARCRRRPARTPPALACQLIRGSRASCSRVMSRKYPSSETHSGPPGHLAAFH